MIAFQVNDMTCGYCVGAITRAVTDVDENAKVEIDLSRRLVKVAARNVSEVEVAQAISQAGYTPVAVGRHLVAADAEGSPPARGCCCS